MTRIGFILALVVVGLGACERGGTEAGPPARNEVGDTTVVHNMTARGDTARLVEVARIGRDDGPEDFLLSGWITYAVGHRGEVYVHDDFGVRVFTASGDTVRFLARRGEGPGEVGPPYGLDVGDDGRLMIMDAANGRVVVMDTSGAALDHWRLPPGRPVRGWSGVAPQPDGEALVGINPTPGDAPPGSLRPVFLRFASNGRVVDTISVIRDEACLPDDPHFMEGMWQDLREPSFPKLRWSASTSGDVLVGCPATYSFDRMRPDGTVLRIALDRRPILASLEERRALVRQWEDAEQHKRVGWRWVGPLPPEQQPAFHILYAPRDGRTWVWPTHARVPATGSKGATVWVEAETGSFDVFEADGTYRGVVPLPEDVRFRWHVRPPEPFMLGDTIWLLRTGTLGTHSIAKMVVEWYRPEAG